MRRSRPASGLACLGRPSLGGLQVLHDAIDIKTVVVDDLVAVVIILEVFGVRASTHGSYSGR